MFYSADFIKKNCFFKAIFSTEKYSTVVATCIDLFNNKLPYNFRDIYIWIVNFIRMLHDEAIIYISSFTEQTTAIIQYSVKGRICGTLHQRI